MKVLLGVTGCIAAYKSCEILRELQKREIEVDVVMTENATRFVSPQTFSALAANPAIVDNFGDASDPIPHIRLAQECDLFLIAPCTANVLAKIACGIADDLLTSTALAAHNKLMVAPAMNVHMYEAPSTQSNLTTLRDRGVAIVEPEQGYLACGDTGKGRLEDPETIAELTVAHLSGKAAAEDLSGRRILVTAGPTRERIDPVRFITNDSSGKMGIALANAAKRRGADVMLVCGPVELSPEPGVETIKVETADEMLDAVEGSLEECDALIFSAAVCDVKPTAAFDHKLKKGADDEALSNIKTTDAIDVLKTVASKSGDRYIVGFAAETDDVVDNGKRKLAEKGADLIVANEVGHGKTFGQDRSKAWLVKPDGVTDLDEMPKTVLADKILDEVCANMA